MERTYIQCNDNNFKKKTLKLQLNILNKIYSCQKIQKAAALHTGTCLKLPFIFGVVTKTYTFTLNKLTTSS